MLLPSNIGFFDAVDMVIDDLDNSDAWQAVLSASAKFNEAGQKARNHIVADLTRPITENDRRQIHAISKYVALGLRTSLPHGNEHLQGLNANVITHENLLRPSFEWPADYEPDWKKVRKSILEWRLMFTETMVPPIWAGRVNIPDQLRGEIPDMKFFPPNLGLQNGRLAFTGPFVSVAHARCFAVLLSVLEEFHGVSTNVCVQTREEGIYVGIKRDHYEALFRNEKSMKPMIFTCEQMPAFGVASYN